MRALITGGHGFVGGWLQAHLEACGDEVTATGLEVDVTDAASLDRTFEQAEPECVYHLAALSHVGDSWHDPADTFRVNALGTLQVLEAARRRMPAPRILVVSSAEVYGRVRPEELPLEESAPLRPVSPYAASKVAAEFAALQAFLAHGTQVVCARPFNHVGPRQSPAFVVAALAERVVAAERSGAEIVRVGNLSARRDLTDVRDVARAYRLLVELGEPGRTYNVCSGRDVTVEDVARRLIELSGRPLRLEVDPALVRPVDLPAMLGDPSAIRAATGWVAEIPLDQTLSDLLDHARSVY